VGAVWSAYDTTTSTIHSGTRFTRDFTQNAGKLRGCCLSSGQALSSIAGPLSDEQLKEYLFHLARDKQLAASTLNQVVSAMRCFYQLVLQRSVDQLRLVMPRVHKAIRRPHVFSVEELERLFTIGCRHPKHRAFL